ncbi:hypothetical protein K4L44_02100 [Halosquirtibacter laminarini]|uniref:Uncharacterized protein n=1 Tax=Halosquirtibacter laminarini TaxID=3374600 RepID=A0AC61NK09_9BACT|nr:hypothetical protein K4L44_02100 [Prolixibacteraceae bacterium]
MRNRDLIKRFLRFKRKRVHKKGHGIHSPFLFSLITGVIDNPHRYYLYDNIDQMYQRFVEKNNNTLASNIDSILPSIKILYCIHRLLNEFQPSKIYFSGRDIELFKPVFEAVSDTVEILSLDDYVKSRKKIIDETCILFCNESLSAKFAKLIQNIVCPDVVIFHGLHWGVDVDNMWEDMVNDSPITASLESRELGIAFSDQKLNKQNFYIKF